MVAQNIRGDPLLSSSSRDGNGPNLNKDSFRPVSIRSMFGSRVSNSKQICELIL